MKGGDAVNRSVRIRAAAMVSLLAIIAGPGCGDQCEIYGNCPSGGRDAWDGDDGASAGDVETGFPWDLAPAGDQASETPSGLYPPGASPEQVRALNAVNEVRAVVGVPPVNEVAPLNAAAQSHADFIVNHCQDYADSGVSVHMEVPDWDGFTGQGPWDRAAHFGYESMNVSEVIAFVNNPEGAVRTWIDSLYHRLLVLEPGAKDMGYGLARGKEPCSMPLYRLADVIDMGLGAVQGDPVALYPPDGATDVPVAFQGFESPQPPPPPGGYPSGYIVTVQFGKKLGFKVISHHLLDETGAEVDHLFLAPYADPEADVVKDPNAIGGDNYVAMYANQPLDFGVTYTVRIEFDRGGKQLDLTWSFTTENP